MILAPPKSYKFAEVIHRVVIHQEAIRQISWLVQHKKLARDLVL